MEYKNIESDENETKKEKKKINSHSFQHLQFF